MGREGESVHEDPQAGGWAPAREGGAPCEQACHCLSSIPWPWRVEEGDEPTQIHDSRSVFAQGGSRCPVPTPCSASCLRCVYVWRNVAMWDPCTSLLDSLPAVTLEEFPSLTLHCSTMNENGSSTCLQGVLRGKCTVPGTEWAPCVRFLLFAGLACSVRKQGPPSAP